MEPEPATPRRSAMRRHFVVRVVRVVAATAIAVTACSPSAPTEAPSHATSDGPTTATPSAATTAQPPSASATVSPGASPSPSIVAEQVGRLLVAHPAVWRVYPGPVPVANLGPGVPLFYLSDARVDVRPCPTPNPKTGASAGCPLPLAALPAGGTIVTVGNNPGFAALVPPRVDVESPDRLCRAVDGDEQIRSVVGGAIVNACLRGPGLAEHEAEVRDLVATMKPAP